MTAAGMTDEAAAAALAVTDEHLSLARAAGTHPVAHAILSAMPGFDHVDVWADRAVCWAGVTSVDLLFSEEGRGYVLAWEYREPVGPFTFTVKAAS